MTIPQLIGLIVSVVSAIMFLALVSRINDRRKSDRDKDDPDIWEL